MPILDKHEGISFNNFFPLRKELHEDIFNSMNSPYLYVRGFLICKNININITDKFIKIDIINAWKLYYHSMLNVNSYKINDVIVFVLGISYFVKEDININLNTAQYLCKKLTASEKDFFEALNYLGGRYVIIYSINNKIYILNDPHGLKSVFYSLKNGSCASHLELLNFIEKENISKIMQHSLSQGYSYSYDFPGNSTKYENLFFLPPNFKLDIDDIKLSRFFPITQRKFTSIYNIRTDILNKYYMQLEYLSKKFNLVMSLTGGKDSQVSFYAASDLIKNMYFYTESRDSDIENAKKIALQYDLSWIGCDSKDIHIAKNNINIDFEHLNQKHIFPSSTLLALRTQFITLNLFGVNNFLHIHSNCAESGRGRARNQYLSLLPKEDYSFENFFKCYVSGAVAWKNEKIQNQLLDRMKNDDFLRKVLFDHFTLLNHSEFEHLGYNPWDFMFIETRSANFLSIIHMLNDIAFDSLSLTNTRDILMSMWSLPDEYINGSCILYNSILNEFKCKEKNNQSGDNIKIDHLNKSFSSQDKDLLYAGKSILDYYFNEKKYNQCIDISNKIIKIDKFIPFAYAYATKSFIKTKQYDLAISYVFSFLKNISNLSEGRFIEELCNNLRKHHSFFDKTLEIIDRILVIDKNCFWAYKQKSHVYQQRGDLVNALKFAHKAVLLSTYDRWSNQAYIDLLSKNGRVKEAYDYAITLNQNLNESWLHDIIKNFKNIS